jgi:hypothetical protein
VEAEAMFQRAFTGRKKFGAEHKSTLGTVNNLISMLRQDSWGQLTHSGGSANSQCRILNNLIKLARHALVISV